MITHCQNLGYSSVVPLKTQLLFLYWIWFWKQPPSVPSLQLRVVCRLLDHTRKRPSSRQMARNKGRCWLLDSNPLMNDENASTYHLALRWNIHYSAVDRQGSRLPFSRHRWPPTETSLWVLRLIRRSFLRASREDLPGLHTTPRPALGAHGQNLHSGIHGGLRRLYELSSS